MLKCVGREPVGLVDDPQLGEIGDIDVVVDVGLAAGVQPTMNSPVGPAQPIVTHLSHGIAQS